MLKVKTKTALELNAIHGFKGIAYDGDWFYLTVKDENKIIKYDVSFNQIECFETCRCYTYICYDSIDDCFWATARDDSSCIYKLNDLFEQIGILNITIPEFIRRRINGITHNSKSDQLFISFSNAIVSMEKHSSNDCSIIFCSHNKRIQGVADFFSCYIGYGISRPKQEIRISSLHGRVIKRINVPSCYRIESMVSVPSVNIPWESHLFILLTKRNGEQFVMELIVKDYSIYEHNKCCCDALECIASEETRIAQFLNEDSDKLINIIHSSDSTCESNAAMTLLIKLLNSAADQERELIDKIQKLMKHCDFCDLMDSDEDED